MADTAQKTDIETILRERIRHGVEELPLEDLYAVDRYVMYLRDMARDPVLRALLHAPFDDEPITPEEEALIEEGREDFRAGRFYTHEEVVQRLNERP